MELYVRQDTDIPGKKGKDDFVTFDLVSELLAQPFAGQDNEIIVEAKSQDFLYAQDNGFPVTEMLKVQLDNEEIVGDDCRLEVAVAGTVNNQRG